MLTETPREQREGRRLSRPVWLVITRDCLSTHRRSPILVLTGSDVAQLIKTNALLVFFTTIGPKPNCQLFAMDQACCSWYLYLRLKHLYLYLLIQYVIQIYCGLFDEPAAVPVC